MCSAPRQVYTVGPSGTSLLMWATTGNHGNQWTYTNVILSNPGPFRVTFQAEVGGDVWTDIALDDISYTAECVAGGKAKVQPAVSFSPRISICFLISQPRRRFFMPHSPIFTFVWSPVFPHFLYANTHALLLCLQINDVTPQGKCSELMESFALSIHIN